MVLCFRPSGETSGIALPTDVWRIVAAFLSGKQWAQAAATCRSMWRVGLDDIKFGPEIVVFSSSCKSWQDFANQVDMQKGTKRPHCDLVDT